MLIFIKKFTFFRIFLTNSPRQMIDAGYLHITNSTLESDSSNNYYYSNTSSSPVAGRIKRWFDEPRNRSAGPMGLSAST